MKIAKLRTWLKEQGLDALLLLKRNNFSWVTNGRRNDIVQTTELGVANLLITNDRVHLITNQMELKRIEEEELLNVPFDYNVHSCEWYEKESDLVRRLTEGMKCAADAPFDDFIQVDQYLSEMRTVLTSEEEEKYEKLCMDTALAVEKAAESAEPGMTEFEIASVAAQEIICSGGRIQVLLTASDERIYLYRHPIPTGKIFERHAMIVACVEREGLVANVTRFVYIGEPPEVLLENRNKLARIDAAMIHHTRPGTVIGEIVKKGIAEYERAGFPDDWKKLHQGGPTGYNSREFIAIPSSPGTVQLNQPFTWNPALPGIKSEDTILVKKNGNHILTKTGNWPYLEVEYEGQTYSRPDLLIKPASAAGQDGEG
ncbi:M24 family metallopeptidase [Alteribacter natronophilus]|uniref:M24 family metallopeptidase n=1 Tax=Alteribacter natronophilus TaxID=2583810 RepID=UPI00110D8BA0|nr:aminopeptidase P family N-terminal domain-containing protein [Alteribacter natronophilus]TMW70407.1 M24 family metallopeptidase [Alteribacter natronophilus]